MDKFILISDSRINLRHIVRYYPVDDNIGGFDRFSIFVETVPNIGRERFWIHFSTVAECDNMLLKFDRDLYGLVL